jgi:hypothetical protein
MTQPTFEDGPPVPMMVDGVMDEPMLRQLFKDLASAATVLSVREKRGPTVGQSPEALSLETVESQLLAGTMRAVQIRYRYSDFEWTDTILSGPGGFRVVRCRHD